MIPKYVIEFMAPLRKQTLPSHYSTDDPVACEEFVEDLLGRGFRIKTIRHDGLELSRQDFDRVIRTAAGMLASKSICNSLGISVEEEHNRFGFTS
jgi:hypothetical protein